MTTTNRALFLGIDLTPNQTSQPGRPRGKNPSAFHYAAINHNGEVIALGNGSFDEILAYLGGQETAFAAVNAPRRLNQGLLSRDDVRVRLDPQPKPGRWLKYRLAEYELRSRGILVKSTPGSQEDCPPWMRWGFALYQRLEENGFLPYPAEESPLQWMESNAYACFYQLLGMAPFPSQTLEGRLQRQLVLYELDLRIPDPMDFFEEITPHRMLRGMLPLKNIYSLGELNALAGAYTARLAALHPEQVEQFGDRYEGQIVLPKMKALT